MYTLKPLFMCLYVCLYKGVNTEPFIDVILLTQHKNM